MIALMVGIVLLAVIVILGAVHLAIKDEDDEDLK